jgi:hypothetical protein
MKEFALVVGLSEHFGIVGHNAESACWKKDHNEPLQCMITYVLHYYYSIKSTICSL